MVSATLSCGRRSDQLADNVIKPLGRDQSARIELRGQSARRLKAVGSCRAVARSVRARMIAASISAIASCHALWCGEDRSPS